MRLRACWETFEGGGGQEGEVAACADSVCWFVAKGKPRVRLICVCVYVCMFMMCVRVHVCTNVYKLIYTSVVEEDEVPAALKALPVIKREE